MNQVISDCIDNLISMKLSQKGHDIFSSLALIISGLFWICFSWSGEFFQILGCVAFVLSSFWFASKSSFAKRFLEYIFEE